MSNNCIITPGTSDQTITVEGDSDLVAGNIKEGVQIFGVTGSVIEATGNATAADVLADKTFSNDSSAGVSGTMTNNGAVTITPAASNQPIAEGYHDGEGTVTGDSDLVADNIKKGVEIFNVTGTYKGYPAPVPQTGQTSCYDADGNEIDCGGTGQDGDLKKGVELPNPRFTDNNDGTVTDNLTGLIWLKNASCGGQKNWNDALTFANQLESGDCELSDGSEAGDWRLPNSFELESLLDIEYHNPPLSNTAGTGQWQEGVPFTNVRPDYYWSSSTVSDNTNYAWNASLNDGRAYTDGKANEYYVWPVRGGQ